MNWIRWSRYFDGGRVLMVSGFHSERDVVISGFRVEYFVLNGFDDRRVLMM